MNILESIRLALSSLVSNKLRSILTMLGIIVGVGSVIALQSIGEGTVQSALERVQRTGTNLVTISPSNQSFGNIGQSTANQNLTLDDSDALQDTSRVGAASGVAPEFNVPGQLVAGSINTFGRVIGTTINYPDVHDQSLSSGSWFEETDISNSKAVIVLGSNLATTLFQGDDPLGKQVRINRTAFTVVGVMNAKGGTGFGSVDDQAYVPITAAQNKLQGARGQGNVKAGKTINSIVVKATSTDTVDKLVSEVTDVLRERHKTAQGTDDFTVTNSQDQLQAAKDSQSTLNIFLVVIASISLFVGGIGIMNIMLVTVTERTREIGIRKAIGAKPWDILLQFMIESVTLCFFGGLVGVGVGVIASYIVGLTFARTAISLPVILLSVVFAIAVGLFFGIYPARRASRLNPIDALRYE